MKINHLEIDKTAQLCLLKSSVMKSVYRIPAEQIEKSTHGCQVQCGRYGNIGQGSMDGCQLRCNKCGGTSQESMDGYQLRCNKCGGTSQESMDGCQL